MSKVHPVITKHIPKYDSNITYENFLSALRNYILLPTIFDKNSDEIKNKLYCKIKEPISDADKRGFIYGFRKRTDLNYKNTFWIKLGRTDRDNPTDRVIREWGGAVIFCLETPFNHRLETLVHYIFDYAHKLRIENGKDEIEWFYFTEEINVLEIVSELNSLLEDFWYNENVYNISSSTLLPVLSKQRNWNKPVFTDKSNLIIYNYLCCIPISCSYKRNFLCNPSCCIIKKSCNRCSCGIYDCLPFYSYKTKNKIVGCSICPFYISKK
jgi:hypothetical protein